MINYKTVPSHKPVLSKQNSSLSRTVTWSLINEYYKGVIAPYTALVLYSGEDTLSFGEGLLAIPTAALWMK